MSVSTPPLYRCPTCERPSVSNPRNLAVFIDGTSNKPGEKNTNVMKLYEQVKLVREDSGVEQRRYYTKGIGAHDLDRLPLLSRVGTAIYGAFEMGLAWNADKNVKDAYRWLIDTYREGDRIYLFGFSRGAYQVRALASMIHEVGLAREKRHVDSAYDHYISIDPYNTETRRKAMAFRKEFCWPGVRIHFVGVWDTVSSLGLIKRDVHITASATVTNTCHFRHALALDERRVKFMPEYFEEVNAYRSNVRSPRSAVGDVKEVWFAGCHSDVGGTSRGHNRVDTYDDVESFPVHSGNVPLLWMRREAVANGLVLEPEVFTWDPEDVDLGREDTMTLPWKLFEFLPIRHQVSFSGTGKHERRVHRFRPRTVIPDQQIHYSVVSGDVYTPRATLRDTIDIPTMLRDASDELWATELPDEAATKRLLTSLLSHEQKTLGFLDRVLFILSSRLDNEQLQAIPRPQWSIGEQSGFDKFALTVIYDALSNFSVSEELVKDARDSLCAILSFPADLPDAFNVLRFATKHETLRRRFIAHDEVIGAIVHALQWTAKSPSENLFLLVADNLRYLANDDGLRGKVVNQLSSTKVDETETGQTRLSAALEVKAPSQLIASLKMIAAVAQYQPDLCNVLKPRIFELAKMERSPVGAAAVEALAALNVPLAREINFFNVLGYFSSILPPLDAEVGTSSPPDNTGDLPRALRIEDSGKLEEEVMRKLVFTIESRDAYERTAATLTLLKLSQNSMVRAFCTQENVVHTLMRQLERKETSLLAAYALRKCLERGMVPSSDFPRAAQLIVAMLNKGWFDDAVGRVGGFDIFRGLMTTGELRQQVINLGMVDNLVRKLERGERHEVRTSLICLDILESGNPVELTNIVEQSIINLRASSKKAQKKGIKILAALAQTTAGEQVIKPRVVDIVKMLLPSPDDLSIPRSRLLGPASALYDLAKNETLREEIRASQEFSMLKSAGS